MSGPRLIGIGGPARGQVIAIAGTVSIGRDESSTVTIPDLAMSRRHCSIESSDEGLHIADLESRNGTLVNGVPVQRRRLADGDQIHIGDSLLLFAAGEAPIEAAAGHDKSTMTALLMIDPAAGALRFTSELTIAHDLIGESPVMREVYRRIGRAAPSDSTVLIEGESGTGKELVARAIHANSPRSQAPFVAINCAALPADLMESELFGHERGAFTGALTQKRGRLEIANGGTVFLDEIGELAPALQSKLLRVLQERQLDRVGGTRPIPINVSIVAASNRDLGAAAKAGTYRQDLYFRLNVVSITLPPLRDRGTDVLLLITYFIHKHAARGRRKIAGLTRQARSALTQYGWPGNVRELENAIERAVVMGEGEWIDVSDLPEQILESAAEPDAGYHGLVNQAKRDTIRRALERADGNVAQAARDLHLQVTYLHRLLKNLGMRNGG